MARAVLFVGSIGSTTPRGRPGTICRIAEAFGADLAEAQLVGSFPLKCRSKDPSFTKLRTKTKDNTRVRKAGRILYSAIANDQRIQRLFAMMTLLSSKSEKDVYPLCIHSETPDGEQFPWEAMWSTTTRNFVALHKNGRWPIARLAETTHSLERTIAANELRIAVILAAADEDPASEWSQLWAALQTANCPANVLGLVSQDNMKTAMVQQNSVKGTLVKIKAEHVGDNAEGVINAIRDHSPHIVHFFCHGVAADRPALEIETREDRTKNSPTGSITITSSELSRLGTLRSLWLVVLNCCQGAKPAPHLYSLAKKLVEDGVPAVVAMRESVQVDDANLFTGHFYPEIFKDLKKDVLGKEANPQSGPINVEANLWASAVQKARRELSRDGGRTPEGWPQWTYPVVYISRDKLQLVAENAQAPVAVLSLDQRAELQELLDVLRTYRESPAPSAQEGAAILRQRLDQKILELEQRLRDV